jgi:hypothetical protein
MSGNPKPYKGRALKGYEASNVLFLLAALIAFGALFTYVLKNYRSPSASDRKATAAGIGILNEVFSPDNETCVFYLSAPLSAASRAYRSKLDIPATDDGLIAGLFDLPGVTEVVVNQKVVMIKKSPAARWEVVQSGAREIISAHPHLHQ